MPIYPRTLANGKEVWDVFVSMPYGRVCRRGFAKSVAKRIEDGLLTEKALWRAGKISRFSIENEEGITIAELAAEWLGFKKSHVRASTYQDYESIYEHHIKEAFGGMRISEIKPLALQRHIDSMSEKPRTANKTLTVLRSLFSQAVLWGYLEYNPAAEVKRLPDPFKERNYLTLEEASLLLGFLKGGNRLLVKTALLTGMRAGELSALRWQDITPGTIRVRRSYRDGVFSEPKTASGRRDIVIPKALQEDLEEVRSMPQSLVFGWKDEPIDRWEMNRRILQPALKILGIEKAISFHDLRHTFAAWLISQGESPKFVQEQLGHHSPEFTMRRYGHLAPNAKQAALERFEEMSASYLHHGQTKQKGKVLAFKQHK